MLLMYSPVRLPAASFVTDRNSKGVVQEESMNRLNYIEELATYMWENYIEYAKLHFF